MYSTYHKLNESFFLVQVFQVIGIYMQVFHNLGVSEFYHCSKTHV